MSRKFDLVVYGASGFTGKLVADYVQRSHGTDANLTWALAGRSHEKLEAVRNEIGAASDLTLIVADAADAKAMRSLCASTRCVISTVGPYQLFGETLLRACVDNGTDYVDLCGEPAWMARMIAQHQAAALASGARIVFSCGFDSVPFDLGVRFLQHHAKARDGRPFRTVHGRVMVMKGGFSGGTAASLLATLADVGRDPAAAAAMANPFALVPGFQGPPQPDPKAATFDDCTGAWSAPFLMAPINTKNVHRTNALLGYAYGKDFVYDERQSCGSGTAGELRARGLVRQEKLQNAVLGFGPTRALVRRFALPKPGMGPSQFERDNGRYEIVFCGSEPGRAPLTARVKGDRDPGYGSTSKMIAECAFGLLWDVDRRGAAGGIWTPGAALGMSLVQRLRNHAGLSFSIDD